MRFVVGRLEDFPPGARVVVRVGGREIGVFRYGDRFYAIRNRCPHQGGPLCEGRVLPLVVSERPGHVAERDGAPLVVCPWHGWQWDMATGEAYAPGDPRVRSYAVSVAHGADVAAEVESGGAEVAPLVAETFDVFVDDEYVVLDA